MKKIKHGLNSSLIKLSLYLGIILFAVVGVFTLAYSFSFTYYGPPSEEKIFTLIDTVGPRKSVSAKSIFDSSVNGFRLNWLPVTDSSYVGYDSSYLLEIPDRKFYLIYKVANDLKEVMFPGTWNVLSNKYGYTLYDSSAEPSYIDTNYVLGDKHYYMIRAVDKFGNYGLPVYTADNYNTSDIYAPPPPVNTLLTKMKTAESRVRLTWNIPQSSSYFATPLSEYETSFKYELYATKGSSEQPVLLESSNSFIIPEGINPGIGTLTYFRRGTDSRVIAEFLPDSTLLNGTDFYWSFGVKAVRPNKSKLLRSVIPSQGSGMGNRIMNGGLSSFQKQSGGTAYGWTLGPEKIGISNGILSIEQVSRTNSYASTNILIPVNSSPGVKYYCSAYVANSSQFVPPNATIRPIHYNSTNQLVTYYESTTRTTEGWIKETIDSTYNAGGKYTDYIKLLVYGTGKYSNFQIYARAEDKPTLAIIKDDTPPNQINDFTAKTKYNSTWIDLKWTPPFDKPYTSYLANNTIFLSSSGYLFVDSTSPYSLVRDGKIFSNEQKSTTGWPPAQPNYRRITGAELQSEAIQIQKGNLARISVGGIDVAGNRGKIAKVANIIVGYPPDSIRPVPVVLTQKPFFSTSTNKINNIIWNYTTDYDDDMNSVPLTNTDNRYYQYRRKDNRVGNRLYDGSYDLGSFESSRLGWTTPVNSQYATTRIASEKRFYGTKSLYIYGTATVYNSTRVYVKFDSTADMKGKKSMSDTCRISAHILNLSRGVNDPSGYDTCRPKIKVVATGYASVSRQTLPTNVQGYWKLDEGNGTVANDASGNVRNGAIEGGSPYVSGNGNGGQALSFNGSTQRVDLGTGFSYPKLSLSIWLYRTSSTGNQGIFRKEWSYAFSLYNDRIQVAPAIPGTNWWTFWNTGFTVPLNTWTHFAWVVDGTNTYVYKNGGYDGVWSYPCSGSINSTANNLYIGYDANNWWWNGYIDDIAVFDRALTLAEIQQFYNNKTVFSSNILTSFSSTKILSACTVNPGWTFGFAGFKLSKLANSWDIQVGLTTNSPYSKIYFDNVSVDNGLPVLTSGQVGTQYDTCIRILDGRTDFVTSQTEDNMNLEYNKLYYYAVSAEDASKKYNTTTRAIDSTANFSYLGISSTGDYTYTDKVIPTLAVFNTNPRPNYWAYGGAASQWETTGYYYNSSGIYMLNGSTSTVYNYNTSRVDLRMANTYTNYNGPGVGGVGNKYKNGNIISLEVRVDANTEMLRPEIKFDFSTIDSDGEGASTEITYPTPEVDDQNRYRYKVRHVISSGGTKYDKPTSSSPGWPTTARGYRVPLWAQDDAGNSSSATPDTTFCIMLDNSPPDWTWLSQKSNNYPGFVYDSSGPAVPGPSGCVAYWMFDTVVIADSTLYDSSYSYSLGFGILRDAKLYPPTGRTVTDVVSREMSSIAMKTLKLDLTDNGYAIITADPDPGMLNNLTNVTMEANVTLYDTSISRQGWDGDVKQLIVGTQNKWELSLYKGRVVFGIGTLYETSQPDLILPAREWNHIAVVYNASLDNQRVKFFINGTYSYDQSPSIAKNTVIPSKSDTDYLYIGGYATLNNIKGHLKDIYIYNRAYSEAQIKRHYSKNKGIFYRKIRGIK